MTCNVRADILPPVREITEPKEGLCPVAWALELMELARRESCGCDVLCRDGLEQIRRILSDAVTGRGRADDVELLDELLRVIAGNADCELARTAAESVLKSMELYAEQWEQHIKRGRCAALYCKSYYTLHAAPDKCTGCGRCGEVCRFEAVAGGEGLIHIIDNEKCTRCGECIPECPAGAIAKAGAVKPKLPDSPVPVGSFEAGGGLRRRRRGGER